jgi:hypothetical protein
VRGTGRFDGTEYAPASSIRANHPGVICISTTPRSNELSLSRAVSKNEDPRGGFQIIPANHAMDSEMVKALFETEWMVVGPTESSNPSPDGSAPLFKYYIRPDGTNKNEAGRTRVLARFGDDKDWKPLPVIHGLAPDSLKDLKGLKLEFPTEPI